MPGGTQVSRDALRMVASRSVYSWMLALPVWPFPLGPLQVSNPSYTHASLCDYPRASSLCLGENSYFPTRLSAKSTQLTETAVRAGYKLQVQFTLSSFFIRNEIKLPSAEKNTFLRRKCIGESLGGGKTVDTEVSLSFIQPTQRGALSAGFHPPPSWLVFCPLSA